MVEANGKDGGDVARRQNEYGCGPLPKASENERSPPIQEGFVCPNVPDIGFSYNATPKRDSSPHRQWGMVLGLGGGPFCWLEAGPSLPMHDLSDMPAGQICILINVEYSLGTCENLVER